MSSSSEFHCVGWVKDAHGLRGDLYIQLHARTADWLESAASLRLEAEHESADFEIAQAKPFKDGLIVKLRGLEDRTAAERWKKARVHIASSLLVAEPGERLFLGQLLDFMVYDGAASVGRVKGFASNGAQDLLRVELAGGREALVPLVEDFIVKIDFENRELHLSLPPGLLEIE